MSFEILMEILRAGTLLLFGTVGEVYAERSGVMNLGVEGMLAAGAATAYATVMMSGNPLLGILMACLMGMALSLIHAFTSISLYANQVVSGLALCMLGIGISRLIGGSLVGKPLPVQAMPTEPFVISAIVVALVAWAVLNNTKLGLAIRAVGDDPATADAAGINVALVRYACVCFGGLMTGLAGAYLSLSYMPFWAEKLTAEGRGWIVIALVIFSAWSPVRAIFGAYLFGCAEALAFSLQRFGMNPYLLKMLPYGATIFVMLVGASEAMRKRFGAPAALGRPYIREERLV